MLLASCLLGIYKEKIFGRELGDRGFPSRSVTSRQWSPRAYSLKGRCTGLSCRGVQAAAGPFDGIYSSH